MCSTNESIPFLQQYVFTYGAQRGFTSSHCNMTMSIVNTQNTFRSVAVISNNLSMYDYAYSILYGNSE